MSRKAIRQKWLVKKSYDKQERTLYSFHRDTESIDEFQKQFSDQFDKKTRFGQPKTVNVSEDVYRSIVKSPFGGIWE